jgi:hypothetical protein
LKPVIFASNKSKLNLITRIKRQKKGKKERKKGKSGDPTAYHQLHEMLRPNLSMPFFKNQQEKIIFEIGRNISREGNETKHRNGTIRNS